MSKTATPTIAVSLTGDEVSSFTLSPSLAALASSPFGHQILAVINGNVTVTPTTGAKAVLLIPPSGSTITKTLKGVAGDTGVPLSLTQPSFLSLATSPGTFVITGNGSESVDAYFF